MEGGDFSDCNNAVSMGQGSVAQNNIQYIIIIGLQRKLMSARRLGRSRTRVLFGVPAGEWVGVMLRQCEGCSFNHRGGLDVDVEKFGDVQTRTRLRCLLIPLSPFLLYGIFSFPSSLFAAVSRFFLSCFASPQCDT